MVTQVKPKASSTEVKELLEEIMLSQRSSAIKSMSPPTTAHIHSTDEPDDPVRTKYPEASYSQDIPAGKTVPMATLTLQL